MKRMTFTICDTVEEFGNVPDLRVNKLMVVDGVFYFVDFPSKKAIRVDYENLIPNIQATPQRLKD